MKSVWMRAMVIGMAAVVALAWGVGRGVVVGAEAAGEKVEGDPFSIDICIVMQGPLTKKAFVVDVGDREIRVCCLECTDDVRKNPEKWTQAVDDRIKDEQRGFYPLQTCVVDGKKLEEPVDVVFRNRLFRLCGDECRKKLEEEPAKYFGLVNRAVIEKQKAGYPLKTCAVSGRELGKDAVDRVVGNVLVRLADAGQVAAFNQNPGEFLAKVREGWRKKE